MRYFNFLTFENEIEGRSRCKLELKSNLSKILPVNCNFIRDLT